MAPGQRFRHGRRVQARNQDMQGCQSAGSSAHEARPLILWRWNQGHPSREGSPILLEGSQSLFHQHRPEILAHTPIERDGASRVSASVIAPVGDPEGFAFSRHGRVFVAQTGVDLLGRVDQFGGPYGYFITVYDTLANSTDSQLVIVQHDLLFRSCYCLLLTASYCERYTHFPHY